MLPKRFVSFSIYTLFCLFAVSNVSLAAEDDVNLSTPVNSKGMSETFRLLFDLKTPRHYSTIFIKETQTLEIRVNPAKASEFSNASFYDDRYVHRVVIKEVAGEVFLNFQFTEQVSDWFVTFKENPWRLIVEFWDKNLKENNIVDDGKITSQVKVDVPTSSLALSSLAIKEQQVSLPENFGVLEELNDKKKEKVKYFQRIAGESIGTEKEIAANIDLAKALYHASSFGDALLLLRRVAVLASHRFESDVNLLWLAGESAYLAGKFNIAKDYFRDIQSRFSRHEMASQATLRLIDMEYLNGKQDKKTIPENLLNQYVKLAVGNLASERAKIASTLRILSEIVDNSPNAATNYYQNLNMCVNKFLVPFEMRKNCAYIKSRSLIEIKDINGADMEIQSFKKLVSNDVRIAKLEAIITKREQDFLVDSFNQKKWQEWLDFEKNARPELLKDVSENADNLFMRAQIWNAVGEQTNAAKLFGLCWDKSSDFQQKNDAAALSAKILFKQKQVGKSEKYVSLLGKSEFRKRKGLSTLALESLREISLSPYRSGKAMQLVVDEMEAGRFAEKELEALTDYLSLLKKTKRAEFIVDKIVSFVAKDVADTKKIENSVFGYADSIAKLGKNEKAAELFAALAKLPLATRRAETAYRAGIAYFRAGQLENAKTSWQLAAGDLSDKRYSALANERLDRIR